MLIGQCLELGEEGLPFAPFAAALRDAASAADGAGGFAGHEREFARLLPELGAGRAEPPRDGRAAGYLFELVGALFAAAGRASGRWS